MSNVADEWLLRRLRSLADVSSDASERWLSFSSPDPTELLVRFCPLADEVCFFAHVRSRF